MLTLLPAEHSTVAFFKKSWISPLDNSLNTILNVFCHIHIWGPG